jgi:acetyl-CoA/propionyl-CoA carboxylase biotin carboxyl carrier protein
MPHVVAADEAYLIGPGPAVDSYLCGGRIVDVALRAGAEAIHPGYGFLAENAGFAREVEQAGLAWIGPPPDAIEAMGSKTAARELMHEAGIPIIPGTTEAAETVGDARAAAQEIGFPVAIKASAGGGGKGLKVLDPPDVARARRRPARGGVLR